MFTNFENMRVQPDKAIRFFFLSDNITLRNRKGLKYFLNSLLKKEGRHLGFINFIFCSDKYLLEINRAYLKHDYYTDIITFDLSSKQNRVEGEVYISTDRVRDNAKQLLSPINREIHRVMIHGLLHLCGYGDKSENEKNDMRQREDFYIRKYFN